MSQVEPLAAPRPRFPSRFLRPERARQRFGALAERMGEALFEGDPLADAAVAELAQVPRDRAAHLVRRALACGIERTAGAGPALRGLFAALDRRPAWVDDEALRRGGELLFRLGSLGGTVLGVASLPYGYASPAGNKPLAASGRLRESAPRRLAETSRFVQAVSLPLGMERFAEGFGITVKVRLMHAEVRRMLLARGPAGPRFDVVQWGLPINQHDMVATTLLFSHVVVHGARRLGFDVGAVEAGRAVRLWKYVGWVMGVREDLLPDDEADCWRLTTLIQETQGPPDEDAAALTRALLESPIDAARSGAPADRARAARISAVAKGFCRALLGDELADGLGVPRTPLVHLGLLVRAVAALAPDARDGSLARELGMAAGRAYWRFVVGQGEAQGGRYEFGFPERWQR